MKINVLITLLLGASTLFISGCSNNAATGAAIGSLVGAGIAKSTGNHKDERMAIGAMAGGIIGAGIGDAKDQAIRRQQGTTTTKQVVNTVRPNIKHVHHYGSESRTHSHAGGNLKHSHLPEYRDNDYSYRRQPSIHLGIDYTNRHRKNRHHLRNRHSHHRR